MTPKTGRNRTDEERNRAVEVLASYLLELASHSTDGTITVNYQDLDNRIMANEIVEVLGEQ